jgi:hypothetical protein
MSRLGFARSLGLQSPINGLPTRETMSFCLLGWASYAGDERCRFGGDAVT